jgi:hypothetical protein
MLNWRAIALAAVLSFGGPIVAYADLITSFSFTGLCDFGCTGFATANLTLTGYTQGTALSPSNLLSFEYSSNITSRAITPTDK